MKLKDCGECKELSSKCFDIVCKLQKGLPMKFLKVKVACLFLSALILLSGCTALEIADMIFDDDCLYRGTVKQVDHRDGQTYVKFNGTSTLYQCRSAGWVDVGDWIEVRDTQEDGCVFSR